MFEDKNLRTGTKLTVYWVAVILSHFSASEACIQESRGTRKAWPRLYKIYRFTEKASELTSVNSPSI